MIPRDVVPERLADEAELAGMPNIRVWGDASAESLASAFRAERPKMAALAEARRRSRQQSPELSIVAISGGADNGAFGAGLLIGWSDAGTRPDFDLVTGVSAGALTAPFVYLGRSRDSELKEVFTRYTRSDIYDPGITPLLVGSGLVDSSPLEALIATHVDDRFLRDVARERRKGRVLLIGTTNLDAQRAVLWDMGRIAMSGHPQALSLFRKVLLASASIPGAFPPVRIKVRAQGRTYEELHVDGGVTQQVFVPFPSLAVRDDAPATKPSARRLFIIRNGKISPEWEAVGAGLFSISQRSCSPSSRTKASGPLSHLRHGAGRRHRFQPRRHSVHVQREMGGAICTALHASALRRRLSLRLPGLPLDEGPAGIGQHAQAACTPAAGSSRPGIVIAALSR